MNIRTVLASFVSLLGLTAALSLGAAVAASADQVPAGSGAAVGSTIASGDDGGDDDMHW